MSLGKERKTLWFGIDTPVARQSFEADKLQGTEDQAREVKDELTNIYIAAAVEAKVAMTDHQKARRTFHGDRERLKALRLPREAELKTKK